MVNLLEDFQEEFKLTYLFIAHDLSMVRHISDRIAVMYLGRIVEIAESDELYRNPLHPYTQALLAAIPIPDPRKARIGSGRLIGIEPPNPLDLPGGCRFHNRCPEATGLCRDQEPELEEVADGHFLACHLVHGPHCG